ncbi:hypothetical protein [Permianibacter aggregans]|uniref:M61 glycyl aminopeptidase n=1 Tax=Permianibacter aggregans TaxID=1510150 RepID=A0A4R6UFU1_9GAMM|nr:hypothetical protein [Permianibacter aggregans]TDQ45660.1 M61 glycyl aminopeptidase [Permianibacter aggregans]
MSNVASYLKRSFVAVAMASATVAVPSAFAETTIHHQQQTITIDYPASFDANERQLAYQWLQQISAALQTVHGEFPQDQFQVTLRESTRHGSTVPWGQVKRGEPDTVLLVINPSAGLQGLLADWTAFHEFSHLMLPYRGYGDIWLSEGLATYYQNIVQARAGLFDEQTMWQRLQAGFRRGENDQRWAHAKLEQVSDNLRETRQHMRVHWSGVLYWLQIDVALREQDHSLDLALKHLKDCCQGQQLSAWQIVRKLDRMYETTMFSTQFELFRNSYTLPDYRHVLSALGVEENLTFNNQAQQAAIRKSLLQSPR